MSAPNPQTDDQLAKWNALLSSDPQYRRLFDAWRSGFQPGDPFNTDNKQAKAQMDAYLRANGIDPSQQGLEIDAANGQLKRDHTIRNAALTVGGIVGGGYGASFLPGMGLTGGAAGAAPAAAGGGGSFARDAVEHTADAALGGGGSSIADILKKIATAGIPIGTALGTRALTNQGPSPEQTANAEQLQQLLGLALKRYTDQQPLQDAVNRQALGGLPTYAKGGM